MSTPTYQCPLTGQLYPQGTAVYFRIVGERGHERYGILMRCATGAWKVITKIGGQGEILPIASEGRAAAPQTIRLAPQK